MSCCAVATCHNYSRKTRKLGLNIVYHVFPKGADQRKLWLVKCKREDNVNCDQARICIDHFVSSDYEDGIKNILLSLPQLNILKPSAVPSVNLPFSSVPKTNPDNVDRLERQKKRAIRVDAINRIEHLSPKESRAELSPNSCNNTEGNCTNEGGIYKSYEETIFYDNKLND